MARTHTIRFASILAILALGTLGGTAFADPQDGGWRRERAERADRSSPHRRDMDARRDDRWARDRHEGRDRPRWRRDDSPRPGRYGDYRYSYDYYPYDYRYRSYGDGYRGYDDGYRGGYRTYGHPRYRRDDGRGDDAALTIAGGVIGGLIGNHATSPENRAAGTVFGAVIGGVLGHAIGQSNNDDRRRRYRRDAPQPW